MRARPPPSRLRSPVIVGRGRVLARLEQLLEATATHGALVQLAGEAGMGKTRLARALAERAAGEGRCVLEGRATALESPLPLGLMQDLLRHERRERPEASPPSDPLAAALPARLLPELGAGPPAAEAGRTALFEAASRYLRARAAPRGAVVILEDLHWADPSSLALIAYLARTSARDPLLLLLTYRPEEAPAGSDLQALRQELHRERLGEEIALDPLEEREVGALLEAILGFAPEPEARDVVVRLAGGSPFVVEELVLDAVDAGRLDPEEGRWQVAWSPPLPESVGAMLLRRVHRLAPADRELLRWAAVVGERFDAELLAAVGDQAERATLEALGRLREAGLVAEEPGGSDARLAFRHALTREAVLGELLGAERRRRHARVLEVAEAVPDEAPRLPLEEVLEHALGARDRAKSLDYSIQAGARAADLGGYAEARAQYERALALWRPTDGLDMRAGLFMRLGYLTSGVGGVLLVWVMEQRSRELFEEARRLYEEIGDTTSAALAEAGVVWSGQAMDVLADLRRVRDRLGPDAAPGAVCQILCRLAEREFLVGNTHAALRTSAEGMALLDAGAGVGEPAHFPGPRQLRSSFLLTSAIATWWLGDDASGRTAMLALADEALRRNDHPWAAVAYHVLSRQSLDWPPDAVRYAERAVHAHWQAPMAAWLSEVRAQAHVQQGEWEDADALLDQADALLAEMPGQPFLRHGLGMVRGELALGRGQPERAIEILEPLLPEVDELCGRIFKRTVRITLARALLAQGDSAGARAALAPLIGRWERAEEGPFAVSALLPMAAVEVASSLGDGEEAMRWSAELAALGSGPRGDYGRALADLTSGDVGGRAIEEAASAVERDGRRWEGAWMRIVGAEAAARYGDPDQAGALAAVALERFRAMEAEGWYRRAEGLLRRLGHRVPGRRTPRGAGGLTAREAEVLGLVVDGLSNRAIAERLVISEGTAGRHVSNVFAKLGAHSRLEAARIAAERDLLESAEPL